ncbi:sensor domain-containing diguanylate cyclase [Chromobacterium sp. IIBBL 290-4]|uniref:sensor domain-containing diguanylate cyclase n=1 Tax=Chromobacterium sp. IIBBL 290-4 TaxID=2953890 RepID=UPI0020B71C32|nr:sensor domain-containing diguanylate cyclase [Chromobacterium sp. IIBBL 290-4]UTH74660.1 GGDEF domain-containing protein [Chromobacterium sp. IIBBL 290-4]
MQDFDRFLLTVVYDIPNLIFVVDPESGRIVYANPSMHERLGDDCVGRAFGDQFPGAGGSHCFIGYKQHAVEQEQGPPQQTEYYDDESENWYHVQQRQIRWIDGTAKIVCVLSEINALKRLQKDLTEAHATLAFKNRELEISAKTDRLTSLYNRYHLDQALQTEYQRFRRYGKPFAMLLADCDHFKEVNDTFGHQTGDIVLIELARLLQANLRATDTLGRWGGEEFLAILPETGLANAAQLADKLRDKIASHDFPVVGRKTASFGVAEARPGEDIKELIARVDQALYLAKNQGRNRVEVNS